MPVETTNRRPGAVPHRPPVSDVSVPSSSSSSSSPSPDGPASVPAAAVSPDNNASGGGAAASSSSDRRNNPPKNKASSRTQKKKKTKKNPRLTVDKRIVDELLLVCGVIGSTADPSDPQKLVPVADCLNWLQDLQRALRRDDDGARPIGLLLGQWRVATQKLLPLVLTCRYDVPLVLTVVKILVILTKPLSDAARRAGRMAIDVKSGKVPEDVLDEQRELRDNALAQSELLMEYKRVFVRHPSHLPGGGGGGAKKKKRRKKNADDDDDEGGSEGGGLLSIFVSLLAEPLSKTGSSRTDADHLTIELVLHLFRNLLCAEPLVKGSAEAASQAANLHQDLISLFDRELVLDVLLVIAQELENRENAPYNLLLMEILHHLLRTQDPTEVARSVYAGGNSAPIGSRKVSAPAAARAQQQQQHKRQPLVRGGTRVASSGGSNSLLSQIQMERNKLRSTNTSRHSHFGGTIVVPRSDGSRRYVSASVLSSAKSQRSTSGGGAGGYDDVSAAGGGGGSASAAPRRKNRRAEPFVGSGRTSSAHTRAGKSQSSVLSGGGGGGPSTVRARKALDGFCRRFVRDCYGPVMKSLKNEFRRDSARLEDGDKVVFFRIVWFFAQWWRVSRADRAATGNEGSGGAGRGGNKENRSDRESGEDKKSSSETEVGQLIFTMDVFTFNLVLNSTDNFFLHKKYASLAQAVSLYDEMMHLLHDMYQSQDSTEHIMALGLMDRLFYASEPLDRLPKLLSKWTPGTYSREYLCDLVELCHVTLKLLDANAKACRNDDDIKEKKQGRGKGRKKDNEEQARKADAVARMKANAAEFDVTSYLARKIVSNHVVFMYTQLLSQYQTNAAHVNIHVAAFFIRLCKFVVADVDDGDGYDDGEHATKNELATKTATLEPMLFNVQLFIVLNEILNDVTIRDDGDYSALLTFAAAIIRHFAKAAETNPMLYVECLFRHPVPHRFCELSTNMYVTEELRMMAERELLLEEQRRIQQSEVGGDGEDDASDEDEEVEFVDEDEDGEGGSIVRTRKPRQRRKRSSQGDSTAATDAETTGDDNDKDEAPEDKMEEAHDGDDSEKEAYLDDVDGKAGDGLEVKTKRSPSKSKEKQQEGAGIASNDGDEDDDDRWNDKRAFVPKRKLQSTEDEQASERNALSSTEFTPEDNPKQGSKKRIRRMVALEEDSDDEEFEAAAVEGTNSSRLVFDDDED